MRINKYLASAGVGSRRKVDELIVEGKLKVNGKAPKLGQKIDPDHDVVTLNGKEIKPTNTKKYYLLNKPKFVLSTVTDDRDRKRKCVVNLIKSSERLFPVGRLDYDSTGMILLTNDGDFANRITHPKFHLEKKYQVGVKGKIVKTDIEKLEKGIYIGGIKTLPMSIEILQKNADGGVLLFTMRQGLKRQIKLMCKHAGLEVKALDRISIGSLKLGALKPGEYRELTQEEIKELLSQKV